MAHPTVPEPPGLEVAHNQALYSLAGASGNPALEHEKNVARPQNFALDATENEAAASAPAGGLRKRIWITALLILAAIAIILGATLGTLLNRHNSTPSNEANKPIQTTTVIQSPRPSSTPVYVRPKSPLAVTAWRSSANAFSIRLFYQGPDDFLRLSAFDSAGVGWNGPSAFIKVRPSTVLAVSCFGQRALWGSNTAVGMFPENLELLVMKTHRHSKSNCST